MLTRLNKPLYIGALFFLARLSQAEVILSDDFNYTNGPLTVVSGGNWQHHGSGTNEEVNVLSGRVFLTASETEDVSAGLGTITPLSGIALYTSLIVNFTNLPSDDGTFFAHFQRTGFRNKLFATTNGAAPGFYRLGIANGGDSPSAIFPMSLSPNTDYRVVTRYVLSTAMSTLWVIPTMELDASVTATDLELGSNITYFALRQSLSDGDGMGGLFVDDLRVGTSFFDVLTNPLPPLLPIIVAQPQSQIVNEGATVTFSVEASGTPPFNYQWKLDGNVLVGATGATLTLSNVTSAQAGTYQVDVSNIAGSTNSQSASLRIIPPSITGGLTILTYNVHGNGATNWSTNSAQVQAIGRQMAYLQPDIITFNEIPHDYAWEMTNFVSLYLPGYFLAMNSASDGFIRSVIASRYIIARSKSWLHNADLAPYGYTNGNFTRDLFEAEIAVPNFKEHVHVFTAHLKATVFNPDSDAAKRAAEAGAISNFFVSGFLLTNVNHPYVLTGDMNEDINRPGSDYVSGQPIQRLVNDATGLRLTTPVNPFNNDDRTISIQSRLTARFDYILPCGLLFSNIVSSQVFRTDLLNPTPPSILADDDRTASDHLPALMAFNNPFAPPFRLTLISVTNQAVTLQWDASIGGVYGVQASSNLNDWSTIALDLIATATQSAFTTNVQGDFQFFRVYRVP